MMKTRNPQYTSDGRIDCDIEHPVHGWIPTTLAADDPGTAELFATVDDDVAPAPAPDLDDAQAERRALIERARKQAEAQGVTVNGIRYAGDPDNRQALAEAIELADDTGQTTFASWKDSDDQFHPAHPVADARAAYRAIGQRRGELIEKESAYVGAINDAETVEAVNAIAWEVSP